MEREQVMLTAKEEIKLPPYWKILAGNLPFAGLVLLMCSISIFVLLFALIVTVMLLLVAARTGKGSRGLRRQRWSRFAIYAVAVFAGAVLANQARENEKRSFDNIIAAVDQYNASEKHYPNTLEHLVPKYLASVPAGKFTYYTDPDHADAHLSHISTLLPESYSYDFKSKKRSISD